MTKPFSFAVFLFICLSLSISVFAQNNSVTNSPKQNGSDFVAIREAMRQAAERGTEVSFLACAKILETASATNRLALVSELDSGIESTWKKSGLKEIKFPEPLKNQLLALWNAPGLDPALVRVLARSGFTPAYDRAVWMVKELSIPKAVRIEMIQLLGESRRSEVLNGIFAALAPTQPDSMKFAALNALRNYEGDAVAQRLLDIYSRMPERLRYQGRDLLFSRKNWTRVFFQELAKGKITAGELPTEQLQKIATLGDEQLSSQIINRWGGSMQAVPSEKQMQIQALAKIVAEKMGNATNGQKIFKSTCAQCHQLFGDGQDFGPNLATVSRHDTPFLLNSLVAPDSFIRKSFLGYELEQTEGPRVKGLLVEERPTYVVLKTVKGERMLVLRDKIKSLEQLKTSLMPGDLLKSLSPDELRDLFAYLQLDKPLVQTK